MRWCLCAGAAPVADGGAGAVGGGRGGAAQTGHGRRRAGAARGEAQGFNLPLVSAQRLNNPPECIDFERCDFSVMNCSLNNMAIISRYTIT